MATSTKRQAVASSAFVRPRSGAAQYAESKALPASDIFLGWSRGLTRDCFVRQLRDMKISVMVETFGQAEMEIYAGRCDRAIAVFSLAYADQNESDHATLASAVRQGKVQAVVEEGQ